MFANRVFWDSWSSLVSSSKVYLGSVQHFSGQSNWCPKCSMLETIRVSAPRHFLVQKFNLAKIQSHPIWMALKGSKMTQLKSLQRALHIKVFLSIRELRQYRQDYFSNRRYYSHDRCSSYHPAMYQTAQFHH